VPLSEDIPATIGRYEIRGELGRGTMGVVYEAYDPSLDRTVALKTVNLPFAVNPDDRETFQARFFAEAQIAARLAHPGIVTIHDVGHDPATGALFIALEHLSGSTLAETIKDRRPLDWREALRITAAVAEALNYAHSKKVVHLDIKPANIMVLRGGQAKLMDFGIARIETSRLKLTASGQFFGTPLFMCPEQALGRTLDGRADLFSLGAVLYTLLTGRFAFDGENIPRILVRVIGEHPEPPSRIVAGLPEGVDYLVSRALAKAPADRYPNGRMLAEDTQDLLAGRKPRHQSGWVASPLPQQPPPPAPSLASIDDLELQPLLDAIGPDHDAGIAPGQARSPGGLSRPRPLGGSVGSGPGEPTWVSAVAMPPTAVRDEREQLRRRARRRRRLRALAGAVGVVIVSLLLLRAKQQTQSAPDPAASPSELGASTSAAGERAGSSSRPAPARRSATLPPPPAVTGSQAGMLVDFQHPLRSGRLRIWVDQQLMLDENLAGRVKKLLAIKVRQGSVQEQVPLAPGRHEIRVQVDWDDNERSERISGMFKEAQTRRLEVRLGRVRKNLSVDWK
jgi:serine/threonine-protein kinase